MKPVFLCMRCSLRSGLAVLLMTAGTVAPALPAYAQPGAGRALRPVYDEWTTYLNDEFGYQVPVPPGMRAQTDPRQGPGCRFVSGNGALRLRTWASAEARRTGSLLEDAWSEARGRKGRKVEFQRRGRSSFSLAGENADGTEFYEKVVLGRGAVSGFNMSYPKDQAGRYAGAVAEVERGFGWKPVRLLEPMEVPDDRPPRGVFRSIRGYFTGEDEPLPPAPRRRNPHWVDPSSEVRPEWRPQEPEPREYPEPGEPFHRDSSQTEIDLTPPAPPTPGGGLSADHAPEASPSDRGREENPGTLPLEKAPPPVSSGESATSPVTPPKPSASGRREDLPYGIVIPGKKGYVYSPFSDKQQVDVSGIPTGTKVKCPYTGKVFRVP